MPTIAIFAKDKKRAEEERDEAIRISASMKQKQEALEKELADLKKKKEKVLADAREEAREMLREARETANEVQKELKALAKAESLGERNKRFDQSRKKLKEKEGRYAEKIIKQVNSKRRSIFTPNIKMVIGIPSGSTEVEIRAVRDSSEHAGGRDVYLIYEPMASALGIGLDVEAPKGNMVVDIGGGTTEIAVISLGGIVVQDSIKVAGDRFDEAIIRYVRKKHNILIKDCTSKCHAPYIRLAVRSTKDNNCLIEALKIL